MFFGGTATTLERCKAFLYQKGERYGSKANRNNLQWL